MSVNVFNGVREKWLTLYEQLKSMAMQKLPAFDEHETSSAVLWKGSSAFAEISAKKDCMVIGFASDRPHDEWEPAKMLRTSKNRVAHYFEVTDDTRFPELVGYIVQAYEITQSGRALKKPLEKPDYSTVDEYIALFPDDVRIILEKLRRTIREAAPDASEKISWKMPTYWQGENLIHFAAAKSHIGIYPGENGVAAFADRLSGYKTAKGTIQLPFSKPIPYDLVAEITRFRVKEALSRAR